MWREMRKNILTASNFDVVVKRRICTPCHNLLQRLLYNQNKNTKSILYGRNNEDRAIKKYEENTSNFVKKCGLFIDREYPFLGASPDGLIDEDGLIEVKCIPSIGSDKLLQVKKKDVCFEIINGLIR
ncbi:hypothetical protein RN001_009056 [Aquatica leii]|uniref:YqaJ viral recombinase domain-containing protein n=1 Tax=Aquatica leii TaxID=1421715 RepID=A0AAN7NZ33_9COLE|nr:hypothetical protein RN001_009056 [Aquatica leii]